MSCLKQYVPLRTEALLSRRQVLTAVPKTLTLPSCFPKHSYSYRHPHHAQRIFFTTDRYMARREATQKWIDSIVIGQKLCPFAPPVRAPPQLRIALSNASNAEDVLQEVIKEATMLVGGETCPEEQDETMSHTQVLSTRSPQNNMTPQTTLLVLDEELYPDMVSFRTLVELSWKLQAEAIDDHGFTPLLQLVLFHPLAKHDTYSENLLRKNGNSSSSSSSSGGDAADYTIRSPYPTIHLLRETDVMKAVTSGYKDLELLPSKNKAKLRDQGSDVCQQRLENCKT